ncbi:hypothetical protein H5368_09270 [Luteimonas sp. MC1782]|uniref:hypothetical protein n=1 Tax=Luteimonas sp. MC1782 TaxID=2760305 RepID=UPI00160255C2|nr:hypothetical protein [Luteimonas sp. MC1782]MBB1473223.1 hypothetical protein [Luteimonas sp. MC1782]
MSDETVPQPGQDSPPPGSRIAFERRDLGMRGLVGYVPIGALPPLRRREYRIPFWFTPGIEQGVR